MKEQLSKLIDVKTIVTLLMSGVLAYLAIVGKVTADQFMVIAVMIFTYFFTKQTVPPANTTTTTETTTSATTIAPPEVK